MAIAMIVMAGGFGAVAAYVLLAKRDAPIVMAVPSAAPVTTAPTASGPVAGHAPTASAPAPVTTTEVVTLVSDAGAKPAVGAHPQGAPPVPGTPKPGGSPTLADPGLRDLIASAGAGPGPAGGGPGSGPQLTEDETRSVVTQHSLAVRRTCWDRNPSAQPSVNEVVHIVINNLGQVTQASATGNDSVVGHCLEDEVRRWRWPGGGEVSVPFHFLRQ
jgi:hypothetical protein